MAKLCQRASCDYAQLSTEVKNKVLNTLATLLEENYDIICENNLKDVNAGKEKGLNDALVDRLNLTLSRFKEMVNGVRKVAILDDPVGEILSGRSLRIRLEDLKEKSAFRSYWRYL